MCRHYSRHPMQQLPTPTNLPVLPSAKPSRPLAQGVSLISLLMIVVGLGLSWTAVDIYRYRSQNRLEKYNQLTALEQQAEINQRNAQLKRNHASPIWISDHTYQPGATYDYSGTSSIEVPVLMGVNRDQAVCIGTLGPEGFKQNLDHHLCLGY